MLTDCSTAAARQVTTARPPLTSSPRFESHVARLLATAATDPDRVVLTDHDGPVSGGLLVAEVHRLAWVLHGLGVRPGHTVAIAAGVTTRAVLLRYAAGLLGCSTVFCPERPDRFGPFAALVRPDLLVLTPSLLALVPAGLDTRVIGADDAMWHRRAPVERTEPCPDGADRDQVAVLISSGGTTGAPKATRRSFAAYLGLVDGPPDASRRQLICTPLAYVAQVLLDTTLVGGGQVVLLPTFDSRQVLAAVERHRATHLGLVEPLLAELTASVEASGRDLSSLRVVAHIGATAPAALRRRWLSVWGPVLVNPYGSSECGIASALADPDYTADVSDAVLGSAGRALPGAVVKVEHGGRPAPPGTPGRIVVRTSGAADGYVTGCGTPGAFRFDGWFASEDVGVIDPEGRLTVLGRLTDQRLVLGRPLLPVDVERECYRHPDVRYAVAVPLDRDPAHPFGVAVTAAAGSSLTAEGLGRWLGQHGLGVDPYAVRVVDTVPVTEQGKPDRAALAALLGAAPAELRRSRGLPRPS